MENTLSRRTLLTAGAAALLASPARAAWFGKKTNLFDILKSFTFTDQQGQPVTLTPTHPALKGKHILLSFFFPGCGLTDPEILTRQAQIAGLAPDKVVHLVIDTDTFSSVVSPNFRKDFLADMTIPKTPGQRGYSPDNRYLDPNNTIALYPMDSNGQYFSSMDDMNAAIARLQNATGGIAAQTGSGSKEPAHYTRITLYKPDGNPATDLQQKPLSIRATEIANPDASPEIFASAVDANPMADPKAWAKAITDFSLLPSR